MPPLLEAYNYGGWWGWSNSILGTLGIFSLGGSTTTTNEYTYATGAVVAGTALAHFLERGAAAGTSTLGVFALGLSGTTATTTTNQYTYATGAVAAGTALTAADHYGSAAGTSTLGIFALGNTATTNQYTYATGAVAAGTALTATGDAGAAAGNYNGGLTT